MTKWVLCSSRKYGLSLQKGLEFLGGGGFCKAKKKLRNEWNLIGISRALGGGVTDISVGEIWIFSGIILHVMLDSRIFSLCSVSYSRHVYSRSVSLSTQEHKIMGIDVLRPFLRDSNGKNQAPMTVDTNKRNWSFRNLFNNIKKISKAPLLNVVLMMSHASQEIIGIFRAGGNLTMEWHSFQGAWTWGVHVDIL